MTIDIQTSHDCIVGGLQWIPHAFAAVSGHGDIEVESVSLKDIACGSTRLLSIVSPLITWACAERRITANDHKWGFLGFSPRSSRWDTVREGFSAVSDGSRKVGIEYGTSFHDATFKYIFSCIDTVFTVAKSNRVYSSLHTAIELQKPLEVYLLELECMVLEGLKMYPWGASEAVKVIQKEIYRLGNSGDDIFPNVEELVANLEREYFAVVQRFPGAFRPASKEVNGPTGDAPAGPPPRPVDLAGIDDDKVEDLCALLEKEELVEWISRSTLKRVGEVAISDGEFEYLYLCPRGRPIFHTWHYATGDGGYRLMSLEDALSWLAINEIDLPIELKRALILSSGVPIDVAVSHQRNHDTRSDTASTPSTPNGPESTSPCPVSIDPEKRKAFVDGKPVEGQLTPEQVAVLKALINVYPTRLTIDEMRSIQGVGDGLGVFKRLIDKAPWSTLLSNAGRTKSGYGWISGTSK